MVLVSGNLGLAPVCTLMPREVRSYHQEQCLSGSPFILKIYCPELDHHIQMGTVKWSAHAHGQMRKELRGAGGRGYRRARRAMQSRKVRLLRMQSQVPSTTAEAESASWFVVKRRLFSCNYYLPDEIHLD